MGLNMSDFFLKLRFTTCEVPSSFMTPLSGTEPFCRRQAHRAIMRNMQVGSTGACSDLHPAGAMEQQDAFVMVLVSALQTDSLTGTEN